MDAAKELTYLRSRIREANTDVRERLKKGELVIQYDAEMDYLYFRFDRVDFESPAYVVDSPDQDETLSLYVEETTLAVVGFDIAGFKERFLVAHAEARRVFEPVFSVVGGGDFRFEAEPSKGEQAEWTLYLPAQIESALRNAA